MSVLAVRTLSPSDSLADLTTLLHQAYADHLAAGRNYVAATQTVETTANRVGAGHCLVAEKSGKVIGTVTIRPVSQDATPPSLYRQPGTFILNQLAVLPENRGTGIGRQLVLEAEKLATSLGAKRMLLDTAVDESGTNENASLYLALGYQAAGLHHWPHAMYQSLYLVKNLIPDRPLIIREVNQMDIPEVVRVIKSVYDDYGFAWEPETYHADLYALPESYPAPEVFWIGEWDGQAVVTGAVEFFDRIPEGENGFMMLNDMVRLSGADCSLDRLYVHKDARRRGIAREMSQVIFNEARCKGGTKMEIWSDKRFTEAHALYQSFGARMVAERLCDDAEQSEEWGLLLDL